MKALIPLLICALPGALASADLSPAKEALDRGFPSVAVQKIKDLVPKVGTATASTASNLLFARALIEDGRAREALAILPRDPATAEERILRARALAGVGDWAGALPHYAACAKGTEFAQEAAIGQSRMLRNTGHPDEALKALESVLEAPMSGNALVFEAAEASLDMGDAQRARNFLSRVEPSNPAESTTLAFLRGKTASLSGDHAAALAALAHLQPLGPTMAVDAAAIKARALMDSSRIDEAETLLEEFIAAHPQIDALKKLFALLDECYAASTDASSNELKRWAEASTGTPANKLAQYYLARFEARRAAPEKALPLLEALAERPEANPMADETVLELAALRIRLGRPEEALGGLPSAGTGAHTDFLRGMALAKIGDHGAAAKAFLQAAADVGLSAEALFNAAICEIYETGDLGDAFQRLQRAHPGSPGIEAARLQRAFHLANTGHAAAGDALEALSESSDSAVAAKARLALAEWKFQQLDTAGSKAELVRVSTAAAPSRQAALEVFLADNGEPESGDKTVDAARAFLVAYPESPETPSVWMKLGEVLFRKGDYASARVELESLARKFPASDYEESALFLAGQSAARMPVSTASEDAILLFEEVASGGGVLSASARMEQAAILAAEGKPLESNMILDKILASAPDRETRVGALIEKGKNHYRLGDKDPANYRLAIDLWKQVAAEEVGDAAWRNQAMTRVGDAYEKLADHRAAVAAYYEVFKPSDTPLPEFFWFYKSGFAAGRLLEEQEKWEEAIRVYELMAAVEGPRAMEAKSRINKLRLEHFLWEE